MNHAPRPQITFITGTDTGVGKTLLTALLLCHLRRTGHHALALKPFCSGSRADARLLYTLQDRELLLAQVNPYFFPEPVAPLVAARKHLQRIPLHHVVDGIQAAASTPFGLPLEHLLVEGAGGIQVPLGEGFASGASRRPYTVLDLISALSCRVIIVARNRLGTINHSLLTVQMLQSAGVKELSLVLMGCRSQDPSTRSNAKTLSELLAPVPVHQVAFLQAKCRTVRALKTTAARLHRTLALVSKTF